MLIVECVASSSGVHGVGLFAAADIPEGTIVWVRHKKFDILVDDDMIDELPQVTSGYLGMIMYKKQDGSKRHVICCDHARHMNHSDTPNCGTLEYNDLTEKQRAQLTSNQWGAVDAEEGMTVALVDIKKGEELLCNYLTDFPDPSDPHMAFLYEKK